MHAIPSDTVRLNSNMSSILKRFRLKQPLRTVSQTNRRCILLYVKYFQNS